MGAIAGAPDSFKGGLFLYGKTASGDRSFGRMLNLNSITEEIPNGLWHFSVIGWDEGLDPSLGI